MRFLITGAYGQLGHELVALGAGHELLAMGYDDLDITDIDAIHQAVTDFKPDAMINAAAYTAVDKAESERDLAFAVNRDGSKNLAIVAASVDIPFVHVSTDYVFDGEQAEAYQESETTSPLGVYGESKLAGEKAVQNACLKYYILRTSWVFSAHGNNFVKTMLRLGKERETLGVVDDQYGKPTSAREIARVIYAMLESDKQAWGIYHIAQPEETSWCGFAQSIFDAANKHGFKLALNTLNAITTEDYPTPAKRPVNSALNCDLLEKTFAMTITPWEQSLGDVIKELCGD